MLRTGLLVVGAALVFVGTIWFLQGMNVLPGSFMAPSSGEMTKIVPIETEVISP